ncbi:unnamed protein product [Adineta steineri]|uniref:F-box domain-containing protein n=2 Tax=Adineta steineri TaxID=433720 RepID=A0A815Q5G4_9BILA|nr:unnamed protein product [Adineta steineri]CAF4111810.1 unnamed protein product [Adineta steineri]
MSIIMKFEYLPNEILMKCFQYLNATDVIYSFNQLNYRFSKLIRNSPLHLSCSQYQQSLFDIYKHMFIKSLTILNCKFDDLFELFQNLSMIKYFKIEHLYNNFMTVDQLNLLDITVEKFIINDSQIKKFEIIEFLLNQMTKLQFFSISSSQIHIIDAIRWQNLITHSLHHLHTFKFCFDSDIADKLKMNDKLIKCRQFQTTFWQQHQWFINYEVDKFRLLIFTTPYIRKEYKLFPFTQKFIYFYSNGENIFDNVTHLTLYENSSKTKFHEFRNIISLTLKSSYDDFSNNYNLTKTLNEIMNTSNVKHLTITETNEILIETIINQLPNIDSLTIQKSILLSLLNNYELYELLKTKIIKLDISISNFMDEDRFYSLYENSSSKHKLSEFNIENLDELLFILKSYPNLSMINLGYIGYKIYLWIQLNSLSLDINIDYKLLNDPNRLTKPKSCELDLIVDLIY